MGFWVAFCCIKRTSKCSHGHSQKDLQHVCGSILRQLQNAEIKTQWICQCFSTAFLRDMADLNVISTKINFSTEFCRLSHTSRQQLIQMDFWFQSLHLASGTTLRSNTINLFLRELSSSQLSTKNRWLVSAWTTLSSIKPPNWIKCACATTSWDWCPTFCCSKTKWTILKSSCRFTNSMHLTSRSLIWTCLSNDCRKSFI